MSHLNALLSDLRNRKIWPIAAALLAALVAVPVLLHHSPAPTVLAGPTSAMPVATATGLPTVSIDAAPQQAPLSGQGRDPFTQPAAPKAAVPGGALSLTGSAAAAAAAVQSVASGASTGASPSASSVTATGGSAATASVATGSSSASPSSNYTGPGIVTPPVAPSGPTATAPAALPASTPKPAPTGLAADEHYDVSLAVTDANGGFTTVDRFKRLGGVPTDARPWLVDVGVLTGGRRVIFAVAPGTTPSGPGTCLPGPLDCELLSVAPGADETITSGGASVTFQVTGVTAATDPSVAAATAARTSADAAGRPLIALWQRSAFALFPYVRSRGVVIDERNLIVGGQ